MLAVKPRRTDEGIPRNATIVSAALSRSPTLTVGQSVFSTLFPNIQRATRPSAGVTYIDGGKSVRYI